MARGLRWPQSQNLSFPASPKKVASGSGAALAKEASERARDSTSGTARDRERSILQ
jgi:hypothetical protein